MEDQAVRFEKVKSDKDSAVKFAERQGVDCALMFMRETDVSPDSSEVVSESDQCKTTGKSLPFPRSLLFSLHVLLSPFCEELWLDGVRFTHTRTFKCVVFKIHNKLLVLQIVWWCSDLWFSLEVW